MGSPFSGRSNALAPAAAAFAALLAVLAYVNALHNPFVFDDHYEILQNASIRDLTNLRAIALLYPTRPLTNLVYAIGYAATGLNPFGYHVISVLLHATNVVLVFALSRRVLSRALDANREASKGASEAQTIGAFASAALFAVHPLMTEAVGYTSSQSELLYSMFFLTSLSAFVRYIEARRAADAVLCGAGFVAALACKETAAVLPLFFAVSDVLLYPHDVDGRRVRVRWVYLPLFLAVAALGAFRVWVYLVVEHPQHVGGQWQTLWLEVYVVARYARLLVWPVGQTILPPVDAVTTIADGRALVALACAVTVATGAWWCWRRHPVVAFGTLWFVLLLAPSAALVAFANLGQPMAEHRTYLANAGAFLLFGSIVFRQWGPRPTAVKSAVCLGTLGVVITVLFTLTLIRNTVWQNPVVLWQEATERSPQSWMAHYGLGYAYLEQGQPALSIPSFERVLELRPSYRPAHDQLAAAREAANAARPVHRN